MSTPKPSIDVETYEDIPEYIIEDRVDTAGKKYYKVKWVGCDIENITWETEKSIQKEWPWLLSDYAKEQEQAADTSTKDRCISYEEIVRYTSQLNNWEEAVHSIRAIEKATIPGYIVYVDWKNGYKSTHHSSEIYAKCPQKMLDFYEKHLLYTNISKEDNQESLKILDSCQKL